MRAQVRTGAYAGTETGLGLRVGCEVVQGLGYAWARTVSGAKAGAGAMAGLGAWQGRV